MNLQLNSNQSELKDCSLESKHSKSDLVKIISDLSLSDIAEIKIVQFINKLNVNQISHQKNTDDYDIYHNLYHYFVTQIEKPLIKSIMIKCAGNQSQAASLLGISRVTLIKKINTYL